VDKALKPPPSPYTEREGEWGWVRYQIGYRGLSKKILLGRGVETLVRSGI
jgi:hypothetical protein